VISIDRVFETIRTLANSDIQGNVKPDEVRLLINNSVNEIIEEYFYEVNRLVSRENTGHIGNGLENIPDRIREKILHFSKDRIVTKMGGYFPIPSDLRYIDSIVTSLGVIEVPNPDAEVVVDLESTEVSFEECKSRNEFNIIKRVNSSSDFPIYIQTANGFLTHPNDLTWLKLSYLRKHKIAKWTFNVVMGNEMFNPSAPDFQDIDLHPSEESKVILKTLEKMGVNLKETDIQSFSLNKQAQEFNEKNIK
jgi:hypothetical protein